MSLKALFFLLWLAVVAYTPAGAEIITLTFDELADLEPITNYYAGGFGGSGSGPGPDLGITFGPDSLALVSQDAGGSGNFANQPSGNTVAVFLSELGDVMNVPGGFTTGVAFYYAAVTDPGLVVVYSEINAAGSVLATLQLTSTGNCSPDPAFCIWNTSGASFSGTARSVDFGASDNLVAYDNVTLGSAIPSAIPEPSTAIVVLLATGAMAATHKRKQRQQFRR